MKSVFPVLLTLISLYAGAQDLPVFNTYFPEYGILNPAFTGMQNCFSAGLLDHHQWLGIREAPNTQAAFAGGRFGRPRAVNHHGLGMLLSRDQNGAYRYMHAVLNYSFHVLLADHSKTYLSLGLGAAAQQDVLNERDFNNFNQDPLINGTRLSVWNPDLTLGAAVYNRHYFGGITAACLLPNFSTLSEPVEADRNRRMYLFFAGMRLAMTRQDLEVEPSLLFLTEESGNTRFDLNVRAVLKNRYWLGVSARKTIEPDFRGAITVWPAGGVAINRIEINYAYGLDFSPVHRHTYGSHFLLLKWNLCRENKGALPCPEAYH